MLMLTTLVFVGASAQNIMPWIPPPADSPELLSFLRNTSRPKLAYSTWVGWYMDGGLNETTLFAQAEAMATKLRPYGWTHVLHDEGWSFCGTSNAPLNAGCIHVDEYGRQYPSPDRYPSSTISGDRTKGTWKPLIDRIHAKGIAFGLHLVEGIPMTAVGNKSRILNSEYTADMIVQEPRCAAFTPNMWAINASHPGAQLYYDSVVSMWAADGVDFVYLDGIIHDCGSCQAATAELMASSLKRLGNGMHLYLSYGPLTEDCSFERLTEIAPYVRVGGDTVDSWASVAQAFSDWTYPSENLIGPNHFGDLASLMVGKVHCATGSGAYHSTCPPGPNYYIPGPNASMTEDEVYSWASMFAMFRSTWWPSGVLTEMDSFQEGLLTNADVIRVTMGGTSPKQVVFPPNYPGIVWFSGDEFEQTWKYVLLVNFVATDEQIKVDFGQVGIQASYSCEVSDLWGRRKLPRATGSLSVTLRPHACMLAKLSGCTAMARARAEILV